ncbi:MAG: DUF99 family protein [Myxococcota bacterium]
MKVPNRPVKVPDRPRLLGIDDGPFTKGVDATTALVAVFMEGPDRVEGVAIRPFPIDGEDATAFLARWIGELRFRPACHGVVLGGITLAGLAVVDLAELAERTGLPVIAVSRRDPSAHRVADALAAAGLTTRLPVLERAPKPFAVDGSLYASVAGTSEDRARALVLATRGKSAFPEPLRVAHLIAAAVARGSSRGRA